MKRLSRELNRDPIIAVPFGPTGASFLPLTGDVLLAGWSVAESTGAAVASLDIFDGTDATGSLLASIRLAANESVQDSLPQPGVDAKVGLFVRVNAGSVIGALWLRDL
jgi:hypothetical protein